MPNQTLYQSPEVVVTCGPDAVKRAADAAGYAPERTQAMVNFARAIWETGLHRGLTHEQIYTAALNTMGMILCTMHNDEDRSALIGATTEALCAAVGGGSDNGQRS